MKRDYYKAPELKHSIVFRENFFERPELFQSSLNEQIIKSVETFLDKKYNFFETTYNGNISRRDFWKNNFPEVEEKLFDEYESLCKKYRNLKFPDYLKIITKRNKTEKTFIRKWLSIEDFIQNCRYCDVISSSNKDLLLLDDEIKKIVNFSPKKLSELIFCYFSGIKNRPKCKYCKKNDTDFLSVGEGYRSFCSSECQLKYRNEPKEKHRSDLSDDKIRDVLKSFAPDIRNCCTKEIADVFLNIEDYCNKSILYDDLKDKEKIFIFLNKIKHEDISCICGKRKSFMSQVSGYQKTCGDTACVMTFRGVSYLKDEYKNIVVGAHKKDCFVYIMKTETEQLYKIGISTSPLDRLRSLQDYINDIKLVFSVYIKDAEKVERELHKKFSNKNIRLDEKFGGHTEFFKLSKNEIKEIQSFLFEKSIQNV